MDTKKTKREPTPEEKQAAAAKWYREHAEFVEWWKEHRHSGYCFGKDHRGREVYRWNIPPLTAWRIERYRVEFATALGEVIAATKEYPDEVRLSWRNEQGHTEHRAEELGTSFEAAHNKKIFDAHGGMAKLVAGLVAKMRISKAQELFK